MKVFDQLVEVEQDFSAFEELSEDKAFDDETLKDNPGAPLPSVLGENESPEFSRDVDIPNYEEEQTQKFKDLKKTVEASSIVILRQDLSHQSMKRKHRLLRLLEMLFKVLMVQVIPHKT